MIRNVVLHINNEQPLLGDLFEMPAPSDVGLKCTNLRDMNGKRPIFVDDPKSVFFFPYHVIRFIEVPPKALAASGIAPDDDDALVPVGAADGPAEEPIDDAELEIDEDFLRRIREV